MKIVIAVNTLTQVAQPSYVNHCQLWYRLGKTHPDWEFVFFAPQRMSIDRMRNDAANIALEWEADYLIFLDDDVLVPVDGVEKLISTNFPVCSGVTLIRGYPYYPMLFDFSDPKCHYLVDWKDKESNDCGGTNVDAVGFSFCAIQVNFLKQVSKPYFMTAPTHTEDVYFCMKATKELGAGNIGFRKDVVTSHILGLDTIEPGSRDARIAFDEAVNPDLKEAKRAVDRGEDYLHIVKAKCDVEV